MSLNLREIFSLNYVREYIFRNKTFILISIVLFVLSVIIGIVASESIKPFVLEIFKQMMGSLPENATAFDEAVFLFNNNIKANIIILLGGLLFSIISVFAIIINGMVVGFTATMIQPYVFIVGIFPHGIFEIPATLLSLVGAFLITKLELNLISSLLSGHLRDELRESKQIVKDIILTFITTFVFIVIAAIIEAYITPALLNMVI